MKLFLIAVSVAIVLALGGCAGGAGGGESLVLQKTAFQFSLLKAQESGSLEREDIEDLRGALESALEPAALESELSLRELLIEELDLASRSPSSQVALLGALNLLEGRLDEFRLPAGEAVELSPEAQSVIKRLILWTDETLGLLPAT